MTSPATRTGTTLLVAALAIVFVVNAAGTAVLALLLAGPLNGAGGRDGYVVWNLVTFLALPFAAALGLAAAFVFESDREPQLSGRSRWRDRTRLSILAASLGAIIPVFTGLLVSFVYLPSLATWPGLNALQVGARVAFVLAAACYLLWTARRVGPGSEGLASIAFFTAVFSILAFAPDVIRILAQVMEGPGAYALFLVGIAGQVLGILSLGLWILVYSRVLRGSSASRGAPLGADGA